MLGKIARFVVAVASLLIPMAAHATGSFRVYLSSAGSDTNPCTVSAPCRLLGAALDAVADGGEIWILDSANFNSGTVEITKSVSILAIPGQVASILGVAGNPAVHINGSGIKVAMRNVLISANVTNPGTNGIEVTNAGVLSIEDAVFANLPSTAIHAVNTAANINVRNSTFRSINGYGVLVENGPNVTVAGSHFIDTMGLGSMGSSATVTKLTVSDSTISKGGGSGIMAFTVTANALAYAYATRCTVEGQAHGVYAQSNAGGAAYVAVSDSTLDANVAGMDTAGAGAVIYTAGNNLVYGNNQDIPGTVTPIAMH